MPRSPLLQGGLAFLTAYLLCWFIWSEHLDQTAWLIAGLTLLAAWIERKSQGVADFLTLLLLLTSGLIALLSLWALGLVFFNRAFDGSDAGFVWFMGGGVGLFLSLCVLSPLLFILRKARRRLHSPLSPWLTQAGAALFVFLPAVPVDCRAIAADPYLAYPGFVGNSTTARWVQHPQQIAGREQLPADFAPDNLTSAATRCFASGRGPRRFSLRASRPVIVVALSGGNDTFSSVFQPGTQQQLTPWTRTPAPYAELGEQYPIPMPDFLPLAGGWNLYPVRQDIPPQLQAAMPR